MPDPTFTEAPAEVPSRAVPSTFSALTDPFLVWEKTFRNELSSSVAWFGGQVTSVSGFASAASGSADAAATSAGTASTKASEASTSASNSATSAGQASTSADNAAASLSAFRANYLGELASDPTLDGNGDPVQDGAWYSNTTIPAPRLRRAGQWATAVLDANGAAMAANNGSDFDDAPTVLANIGALPVAGGTMTGALKVLELQETVVALAGMTPTVDCETGTVFTLSTTGNTTFTFSNPPATGTAYGFTLKLTAGGTHTITWPASVDWAGATAPDAPASGETDVLTFFTTDGGTTWLGFLSGDAVA